ncbi:MAG: ComEC/Rec2 family competence protein, partial [Acidobacteriota bacterium]
MFAGAIAPVAFLTPSRAVGIGCVALCAATLLWRRHPSAAMAVFAASMALAGHASAGLARRPQDGRLIDAPQAARSLLVGVPVLADAEVLDEPRRRGDDTMVRVALHRLRRGRVQRDVQDTVRLLSRGGLPPLSPGDRLRAWVTLRIVEPFANLPAVPGSRPFLAARLKSTRLIEQIRPAPAGPVRWLARLRRAARGRLDAGLAAGGATRRTRALAAALTYGDRERLEAVDRDRLMTAGATHILAISGLHVAILVGGLTLALGAARIGPRTRVLVVGAALATYLLLIPVRPSVVRAGLMGATLPGARWGGRALDTLNLLGAIGLACLVVDPALAGDAGFILSFTVTASLVHHTPARSAGGKKGWIHRLLAASFFAAAVSAPLTATFFGRIALAAPLANPFIVPLATGIVALSGVASGVSAIHPVLAMPLALPLQLLADTLFHVADLAGHLGLPLLLVPRRRGLLVMGTVATMFLARRMDRSWRWPAIAAATAGLLAVAGGLFPPRPLPPGHLSLRALDVGQGDALLVGLPDGQALLIDGGGVSGSSFDVGSRVVVPALVDAGIT